MINRESCDPRDSRDPRDPRDHNIPGVPGDHRDSRDVNIPGVPGDHRDPRDVDIPVVPGDHRDPRDVEEGLSVIPGILISLWSLWTTGTAGTPGITGTPPPHTFFSHKKKGGFLPPHLPYCRNPCVGGVFLVQITAVWPPCWNRQVNMVPGGSSCDLHSL